MKTENRTYNHLNIDQRCVIRDMVYAGKSAREIARELNVSASTIVREIKRNRIIKLPNIRKSNISIYCKNFDTCTHKGDLCDNCLLEYTLCQRCKLRKCNYLCKDYEVKLCPKTAKWPYICQQIAQKETHVGYLNVHTMVLMQINNVALTFVCCTYILILAN